jgi:DNA-binding NtrC family response regulator
MEPDTSKVKATVLIVDDERNAREGLRSALEDKYEVFVAADAHQAMNVLETEPVDLMLTDLKMAGEDGLALILKTRSLPRQPICILMTAYGSVETAVEAMKRGASDYLTKPLNLDEVDLVIARHLRSQKIERENDQLKKQIAPKDGLEGIIGQSQPMVEIFDTVRQIAPSRATVLIEGESGTGKELIARAIHRLSPRGEGPLVAVHCAALTPQLLESELFGHERGAFTGAVERRIGRFEAAHGGTIFLDEIGEIDPATQVKILRVLGERSFERVGGNKTLHVDVRLVAATNKELRRLVEQGKFRDDLFFRLNVVQLRMPALRERATDIPLLVRAFLEEFNRDNGKRVRGFSQEAMQLLLGHRWPGNVRELRAAVEHAVVLARGEEATANDLPQTLRGSPVVLPRAEEESSKAKGAESFGQDTSQGTPSLRWEEAEKQIMLRALDQAMGNRSEAARLTGMSRRTFYRRLKQHGIPVRAPGGVRGTGAGGGA